MNSRLPRRIPRAPLLFALAFAGASGGCVIMPPAQTEEWAPPAPIPVAGAAANGGSLFQVGAVEPLFEDLRARRVGDIINVELDERTDATKSATTSANKSTSIELPTPTLLGGAARFAGRDFLNMEATAGSDFNGAGDSAQSNRLSGTVAVSIIQTYPNGNLAIRGQKRLTLNRGSEVVRVAGIVRGADIRPDNSVRSSDIADARITYSGEGLIADANRAGWLTRILQGPLWPF